jgi:hypothetical protein
MPTLPPSASIDQLGLKPTTLTALRKDGRYLTVGALAVLSATTVDKIVGVGLVTVVDIAIRLALAGYILGQPLPVDPPPAPAGRPRRRYPRRRLLGFM